MAQVPSGRKRTRNTEDPAESAPVIEQSTVVDPMQPAAKDAPDSKEPDSKEPDSKEVVLNAAQALITQHGFTGLSMRELARHSGIAKGTIYYHFQDKRQIYLDVLERDILVVRDHLLIIVEQDGSFADKLRALVEMYFELQRARKLVIMSALRENAALDKQFSHILKKYRSELLQPIGALIRQGIDNGEVREVNVELTVLSLLGILQGFVVHQLILANSDIDETVIRHIVTLFAQGVMTPSAAQNAFADQ